MTRAPGLLERVLAALLTRTAAASSAALVLGVVLWLKVPDSRVTRILEAGIVLLMLTPLLRVALAAAEAVRGRDWPHLAAIAAVTVLLALTLAVAWTTR